MTFSEYERLLKLSDVELHAEVNFDYTMSSFMADTFNYYINYYNEKVFNSLRMPLSMIYLDGI